MISEQDVKLAERLYECRDTCKKLYGADWKDKIQFHTNIIRACMKKYNLNELRAAKKLIDDNYDADSSGVFTLKVLAAVVEMIEPTE